MITAEQVLYNLHVQLHPDGQCKQGDCRKRVVASQLAPLVHDMITAECEAMLADLREAAEVHEVLTESGNPLLQVAAGRLNFVRKYKRT